MNPELLLQQARAALERGASQEEVNARIRVVTGGEFTSLEALQIQAEPPEGLGGNLRALGSAAKDVITGAVTNPREHFRGTAEDLLSMYQGLTLGWGDEILDALGKAMGKEGVGGEMRRALEEMPTRRRVAGEIAGG